MDIFLMYWNRPYIAKDDDMRIINVRSRPMPHGPHLWLSNLHSMLIIGYTLETWNHKFRWSPLPTMSRYSNFILSSCSSCRKKNSRSRILETVHLWTNNLKVQLALQGQVLQISDSNISRIVGGVIITDPVRCEDSDWSEAEAAQHRLGNTSYRRARSATRSLYLIVIALPNHSQGNAAF